MEIKSVCVILGNGPSLHGFDFPDELAGLDSFGMNCAYRYWDKIHWYPTYFASCDEAICFSHRKEYARLVINKKEYGIKKFLLGINAIKYLKEIDLDMNAIYSSNIFIIKYHLAAFIKSSPKVHPPTSAMAALWAASLGYKLIILLGVDMNYVTQNVDYVTCKHLRITSEKSGTLCAITSTPQKNNNYFFDEYQLKNDLFHMKDGDGNSENRHHQIGWQCIPEVIKKFNAKIINANPTSNLELFEKIPWEQIKCLVWGNKL